MEVKDLGRVEGLSAYEVWLSKGHIGTEEEYLASLKGANGQDGEKGDTGNGIQSITKTGTEGLVDTYTILFTDGTTTTYTVTNGSGGSGTSDFDNLTNRPKYNGNTMSSETDIPEVKTNEWDAKMDAVSGAVNGNLASLNSSGEIQDSGFAIENVDGLPTTDPAVTTFKTIEGVSIVGTGDIQLGYSLEEIPITIDYSVRNAGTRLEKQLHETNWNSFIIKCKAGDKFLISGTGGNNGRLWGFADKEKYVLSASDAALTETNLLLTAPANSAFLACNFNGKKTQSAYKVSTYSSRIKDLETNTSDIEEIRENADNGANVAETFGVNKVVVSTFTDHYRVGGDGNLNYVTGNYSTSDYIRADAGNALEFSMDYTYKLARYVGFYDEDKEFISRVESVRTPICPANTKYIRFTLNNLIEGFTGNIAMYQIKPTTPLLGYNEAYYRPELHYYLPKEICIGVGRTIELYNELVCLEAKKYNIIWDCRDSEQTSSIKGVQYDNKWSYTAIEDDLDKTFNMVFSVYDDSRNILLRLTSTIKVVGNNIGTTKNIIPIGDSLTNGKAWLQEVQTLSNDKIKYVGTRGRADNTIRHEGRSGWKTSDYNKQFNYTFETNYFGNPSIAGNTNPFWDGEKFSLSHYITTQEGYVDAPDAVQILLGTNGIQFDATDAVNDLKTTIDNIIAEYPSMPIFLCNIIYKSNQNGFYSTGSDNYSGTDDNCFEADLKRIALFNKEAEVFNETDYPNVHIVPLGVCMDRENNFGQVEISINPRLTTVKKIIPSESIHPQSSGYYQMADVMYSSYIAYLS